MWLAPWSCSGAPSKPTPANGKLISNWANGSRSNQVPKPWRVGWPSSDSAICSWTRRRSKNSKTYRFRLSPAKTTRARTTSSTMRTTTKETSSTTKTRMTSLTTKTRTTSSRASTKREAIGFYADQLLHKRDLEPPNVTVRLRPYRLLHMMRKAEDLDREGVDTLLAAGVSMVPVLLGAIRAVARGIVEDEGTALPENSLALLGELAPVSIVPDLLAACAIDDVNIAGCAGWALDRIAQREPDGVREAMIQAAPNLSAEDRLGLTIRLARAPELDSDCAVIENLARNLDTLDRETVTMMMPVLVSLPFAVKGRAGGALARSILRRNGSLVSGKVRAECEAIIEGLTESGAPPPLPAAETPVWSVYDICGGQATWDAGEDEFQESGDDDFPEPVNRAPALGRNDPCWCGSGKKYKKCHLDADREQESGSGSLSWRSPPASSTLCAAAWAPFLTRQPPKPSGWTRAGNSKAAI
jgi:hypothetical protein